VCPRVDPGRYVPTNPSPVVLRECQFNTVNVSLSRTIFSSYNKGQSLAVEWTECLSVIHSRNGDHLLLHADEDCRNRPPRFVLGYRVGSAIFAGAKLYIQSPFHFLCPTGKHYFLPYHFSASRFILLSFHNELIYIIMHAC